MKLLLVPGFLSCAAAAFGQLEQDSVKVYELPEVVVTATRSELPLRDSPSPIDIIQIGGSRMYQGTSVADVLQASNGVFLQDLGGNGALKTVFMRGTAPQHLLVLLNGNRINSFQNGLVDFSLLPLNDIERIEVVRGGSSALYGADALGGVINILTRSASPGIHIRTDGTVGSYGYQRWLAEGQGRDRSFGVLGGFMVERGKDDYPFLLERSGLQDTSLVRANSDFVRRQIYLEGDVDVGEHSSFALTTQVLNAERGVPGPTSFPTDAARQKDDETNVLVSYRMSGHGGLQFNVKTGFRYSLQTYQDPNPLYPIDTYYRNTLLTVNPQIQLAPTAGLRWMVGGEFSEGRLSGKDFSGRIARVQKSIYTSGEYHVMTDRPWLDKASVYGMLRYDSISDIDNVLMPKVGFNARLWRSGDVRIRASYGTSFRAPSFNDLYYVGFSNPDLKPERSTGIDVGVTSDWEFNGLHSLELTFFRIQTRERILFDLVSFLPVNIGKTESKGLETRYAGTFFDGIVNAGVNYSFTDSRKKNKNAEIDPTYNKQLLFIPKHIANASVTIRLDAFHLSLQHTIVGTRYITEDNSGSLPVYRLTDAGVGTTLQMKEWKIRAMLNVNNIFDFRYQIAPDYPMPGRVYRINVGLEY